jgi:hypothetical protein
MKDILFSLPGIALTILCWGAYGTLLHKGQDGLAGNRLKPLICVGLAYLVIAIVVPCVLLAMQGKLFDDWSPKGVFFASSAGVAGAFGALGIVLALTAGGKPTYVMPLVFGGAPIINVVVAMYAQKIPWKDVNPVFFAGLIMVGAGAVTVLLFAPKKKPNAAPVVVKESVEESKSQAVEKNPNKPAPDDAESSD